MVVSNSSEIYPHQLLAQKLNNRAAECIEVGQYSMAIGNLVRALKISEEAAGSMDVDNEDEDNETQSPPCCSCQFCCLDYCMTYSQQVSRQSETSSCTSDDGKNECGGYVYQRPIRVSPQTMTEGHSMGSVLPLILTFNLALAHHLAALPSNATHDVADKAKLQRVLRLYELAYRWQFEEESIQAESLRFTIVIANNLGEIHRAVSNRDKHQKCLEHLLSTLMFMVDCHQTSTDGASSLTGNITNTMDMDGFLRNTSELILHSRCAGAA